MNVQPLRVGFAGLGRMGEPMARNLVAAGFPLTVWNRTPEKALDFSARHGSDVAATPGALAAACDVVVTMVADVEALEAIYFDDPRFIAEMRGGVALDMSTIGPDGARAVADRLRSAGVGFVEAPVSGSTAAAEAGTLTILGGGGADDFARVVPVLEAIGEPVLKLGEVGAGGLMKLAINAMIYGINQCLAEALILADRGGIEPEQAYGAILESAAAAPVVTYRRDAFLAPDSTPVSFALNLEEKDLRLTVDLARRLDAPTPQAIANRRVVQDAIDAGHGERDIAYIAQYMREVPK
jgi:3-hydroxyisobutyrate dehydrogenase